MSCLGISGWKAFLTKPSVCEIVMINRDVTMKEISCKHNAKCLNFYLYTVSCRSKISGTSEPYLISVSVTLLEFLLNLKSLQSDFFLVHFSHRRVARREKLSAHFFVQSVH